jgi:hypothetical protein
MMKRFVRCLLVALCFSATSGDAIARDFVVGYSVLSASAAQLGSLKMRAFSISMV